jgi:hypothetical protein
MYLNCDGCGRGYDDAKQWTICPHSPLGYAVDDLCPRCDTLRSVHGLCRHQVEQACTQPAAKHVLLPGFYWLGYQGTWTVGRYDGNAVWIVGRLVGFSPGDFIWGPRIEENLAQREEQPCRNMPPSSA